MKSFTATQAKQNFGELIDAARIEDVIILKNGHPFVVVSNALKQPDLPYVWDAKRKIIESYFNGNITRAIAMRNGGYELYRQLLMDASYLSIKMPRVSDEEIKKMSDNMSRIITGTCK